MADGAQASGAVGAEIAERERAIQKLERLIRGKIQTLPLLARGMWHEVRYLIDQSDRPGHLQQGGCPILDAQLTNIVGCDSGTSTRLLQDLTAETCGLLKRTSEGIYFAPDLCEIQREMSAIELLREPQRKRHRERARQSWQRRKAAPAPALRAACAQSARTVRPECAQGPPPLPGPPSDSPPDPTPTPAAEAAPPVPAEPAKAGKPAAAKAPAKRKSQAERSDREWADFWAFAHWFSQECWPRHHGGEIYDFKSDDRKKVKANFKYTWIILDELGWNLDNARAAAEFFEERNAKFHYRYDEPIRQLARKLDFFLAEAQRRDSARSLRISEPQRSDDANGANDDYAIPAGRRGGAGAGVSGAGDGQAGPAGAAAAG